jgi:hypothetical protein
VEIALEVVVGDALDQKVDLLILKHAQAAHGLDEIVESRLGLRLEGTLPPGEHQLVPGGRLAARDVLFIGVPTLDRFRYADIADFAQAGLEAAARTVPDVREIALTLHGAGYGLDELACAEAELAGLLRGIGSSAALRDLRRVRLVERDRKRAERITKRFRRVLDAHPDGGFVLWPASRGPSSRLGEWTSQVTKDRAHAFVAMPFDKKFDDLYGYGMSAAINANGLLSERIDKSVYTGDVLDRIKELIETSVLVVANLTDDNPNVFLEIGYSWGRGKPTVLLCERQEGSQLRFDVQGEKCIFYTSIKDCEQKLEAELRGILG